MPKDDPQRIEEVNGGSIFNRLARTVPVEGKIKTLIHLEFEATQRALATLNQQIAERDQENARLRALLALHNIPIPEEGQNPEQSTDNRQTQQSNSTETPVSGNEEEEEEKTQDQVPENQVQGNGLELPAEGNVANQDFQAPSNPTQSPPHSPRQHVLPEQNQDDQRQFTLDSEALRSPRQSSTPKNLPAQDKSIGRTQERERRLRELGPEGIEALRSEQGQAFREAERAIIELHREEIGPSGSDTHPPQEPEEEEEGMQDPPETQQEGHDNEDNQPDGSPIKKLKTN